MQNYTLYIAMLLMIAINGSIAFNWQPGSKGKVMWASDCDFKGNDVNKQATAASTCGDVCAANAKCDHFTWSNGVCYMKAAVNPPVTNLIGAVCGWVATNRPYGHIQYAIRWGLVPIRGVNLGGWLVVENWINSNDALWNGVSSTIANGGEYVTMQALGHAVGDARFQNHWNTFITEQDIANLANNSLNAIRVPVGWWIVGYDKNDPSNQQAWKTFAPGGLAYLDRLINHWAVRYNVAVLVGIHAAKGSQNGNDHSAPTNPHNIYWDKYQENIDNTIEVARFLAARYQNSPAFLGIELINEPTSVNADKLKQYYISAYNAIRSTGNTCVIVISPLLNEQNAGTADNWEGFMPPPTYQNVWVDWHKYLIWGYDGQTANWLMNQGVQTIANDIAKWNGNWLFMGEWSLASPSSATFTDVTLKQYFINMFNAMNAMHSGWTFWTWKQGNGSPRTNGQGTWCFRDLLRDCVVNPKLWDSTSTKCP